MKKMYNIFTVDELRKRYSGNTSSFLKVWGYSFGNDDIRGEVELTTKDEQTPDLHQLYLVTIEPMPMPMMGSEEAFDFVQARRKKDEKDDAETSGIKTGRKFR